MSLEESIVVPLISNMDRILSQQPLNIEQSDFSLEVCRSSFDTFSLKPAQIFFKVAQNEQYMAR